MFLQFNFSLGVLKTQKDMSHNKVLLKDVCVNPTPKQQTVKVFIHYRMVGP